MRNLPRKKSSQITYCQVHAARWAQVGAELGLDPAAVAQFQEATDAARLAFAAQQRARDAARSATGNLNIALEEMNTRAAALIGQIRSTATATTTTSADDSDRVYLKAWIPIPRKRSKLAPPGKPVDFTAKLQQIGWVELIWKCKNPRGSVGTIYHIHRQLQSLDGTWTPKAFLGTAGTRTFTDATVPPGCTAVRYHVQALRSTAVGESAEYEIHLGSTIQRNAPGPMQLAA